MVLPSFLVLARRMRRLAVRVRDCMANIDVIAAQTAAAVFIPMQEIMISLDNEFNKYESSGSKIRHCPMEDNVLRFKFDDKI